MLFVVRGIFEAEVIDVAPALGTCSFDASMRKSGHLRLLEIRLHQLEHSENSLCK